MIAGVDGLPDVSFRTDEAEVAALRERLTGFVSRVVDEAGAEGVVVCMSGGVDSSLTAALCAGALGPERVVGLLLPCHKHEAPAAARRVADDLGVEAVELQMRPVLDAFEDAMAPAFGEPSTLARGNALARLRMTAAYYAANRTGRLVAGTSNRTELLLGYCTKHGDAAADLRPLAPLYKTEVRALARDLGLPDAVVTKPSTDGFEPNATDEADLGAPYGLLDVVLRALVDRDLGVEGVASELGVSAERVREYAEMHVGSAHKRDPPPAPDLGRGSHGDPFHELETRLE